MNSETGRYVIAGGVVIVIIGLLIYFFHDKLHWIGNLPGDIRVERENVRFYFPITTMIVLSVLISVFVQLFRRLF